MIKRSRGKFGVANAWDARERTNETGPRTDRWMYWNVWDGMPGTISGWSRVGGYTRDRQKLCGQSLSISVHGDQWLLFRGAIKHATLSATRRDPPTLRGFQEDRTRKKVEHD